MPESKASQRGEETESCSKQKILRCSQRLKEKMEKKIYKYCKNADNWDRYKASRNKVTLELSLARYEYVKGLASQIKGDNMQFWKCVRSKT